LTGQAMAGMHADLGKNYFELFGLLPGYEIDLTGLAARYRELQRRFHPDRFAAASAPERRLAVQMTAQINAAYQTLRDPVARGRYLLGLQGVSTDEETDTRMDPAFLMEQMELRESLDEARLAPGDSAPLAGLRRRVDEMMETKTDSLRRQFAAATDAGHRQARQLVRELQFLHKLADEIDQLE
jgi:molecular chaperone HscB